MVVVVAVVVVVVVAVAVAVAVAVVVVEVAVAVVMIVVIVVKQLSTAIMDSIVVMFKSGKVNVLLEQSTLHNLMYLISMSLLVRFSLDPMFSGIRLRSFAVNVHLFLPEIQYVNRLDGPSFRDELLLL